MASSRTTAGGPVIAPKNRATEATRWEHGADFFPLSDMWNLEISTCHMPCASPSNLIPSEVLMSPFTASDEYVVKALGITRAASSLRNLRSSVVKTDLR